MKRILSTLALVVASIIAIWAMLLPPQGEVSQSVLIEVAQFLLYSATLLGVDIATSPSTRSRNSYERKNRQRGSRTTPSCCMFPLQKGYLVTWLFGYFFVFEQQRMRVCQCDMPSFCYVDLMIVYWIYTFLLSVLRM